MSITITLGEIWQSNEALQALLNSKNLSAGVAWRLSGFMPILERVGESQMKIVEKHGGEISQENGAINIPNHLFAAYSKDFESLMAEKSELNITVTLEEIADAGLSPRQLYTLRYMISDDSQNGVV